MRIHFFTPPPAQRIGGLDAAINGLRDALERNGIEVDASLPATDHCESVAHFHGLWQSSHIGLARQCVARGIPYIISPHGMLEPWAMRHKWWKKWPYFHLIEKRCLARANAVLATGRLEAERLSQLLPRQRIESFPLGLTGEASPDYHAARASLGWQLDERVLLFLSRLHVKKGLDLLMRVLASAPKLEPLRLVIVGGGEERYVRSVRQLARDLSSSLPRVDWIGEVWGEKRWAYFQGADLFCLPTHSENFGLAVLEACQVGTLALTTSTTPWAEHLADGRGLICDPNEDSVRAQLERFFSQPRQTAEQRRALADWARSSFHWDSLAPRYAALYRSLAQAA